MKIAAQASPADIDAAVSAAKAAFDFGPWPRMTPGQRQDIVSDLMNCMLHEQMK